MCLDCGCKKVDDDHGDGRHLTMKTMKGAAEASKISVDQVTRNIQEGVTSQASKQQQSAS